MSPPLPEVSRASSLNLVAVSLSTSGCEEVDGAVTLSTSGCEEVDGAVTLSTSGCEEVGEGVPLSSSWSEEGEKRLPLSFERVRLCHPLLLLEEGG
ncbi:hypothetical protein FKM82_030024 [Ascaphus truei]